MVCSRAPSHDVAIAGLIAGKTVRVNGAAYSVRCCLSRPKRSASKQGHGPAHPLLSLQIFPPACLYDVCGIYSAHAGLCLSELLDVARRFSGFRLTGGGPFLAFSGELDAGGAEAAWLAAAGAATSTKSPVAVGVNCSSEAPVFWVPSRSSRSES